MNNERKEIVSIEIINTSWSCIGPGDIREVKTKVYRKDGRIKISTYEIPESIHDTYEYRVSIEYKVPTEKIDEFFKRLNTDIKVSEWIDDYSVPVCDGHHWDVYIDFEDGTKKKVQGTIKPPTNSPQLKEMIYELLCHKKEPWIF